MALSFEELYKKHFGATKYEMQQAKSKNPTPDFISTSGVDTRDKYLDNFKGSSKAYSRQKQKEKEEEAKRKAIYESQNKYKNNSKNKYDDGSLWSGLANREYLNKQSQEEKHRISTNATLSSYQKKYIEQKLNNIKPAYDDNRMIVSDNHVENYWKKTQEKEYNYARNQINYYTEKLDEMGIEAPSPEKDSVFDKILRTGISVFQIPSILGNGVAGFFNKGFEIAEEKAKNGDKAFEFSNEMTLLQQEITEAKKSLDFKKARELTKKKQEMETEYALSGENKLDFSYLGDMFKAGKDSSVATAKSLISAPFTDKDYNEVVDISTMFDTIRKSEYNESAKELGGILNPIKEGKWAWVDDVAINLVGEVVMSKNFDIDGLYDSIKVLRRADDVKSATNLGSMTDDNIESAKQIIRENNRTKVTDDIKVKFQDLDEEAMAIKVEEVLDGMADKEYKTLIKRTGKQLDGLSEGYKGVTIGDMKVVSPEVIEKLSKTKFGRALGNTTLTALNPLGSVYDGLKHFSRNSLMRDGAVGKAMVGGKTQDSLKDVINNFNKFVSEGGDSANVYRAVANKYDIDKIRLTKQFMLDKIKDKVRTMEKEGKKAGINEKNMEDLVERLEKDGIPTKKGDIPYDVKEDVVDSVGTTNKEAFPEIKKARDEIRKDMKIFKKMVGEEKYNKFMESLKVDEGKLNEVKQLIGDKLDGVVKKRETQIKRYETRIKNGTGNIENITKKLNDNKELIERLKGRDLSFLPDDVKESVRQIIEGKKLDNINFEKEIDELNARAVKKNTAEYMSNNSKNVDPIKSKEIFDKTVRGLSAKDSSVKNIINSTDDVETLMAYEKSINDLIEAHHKNLDDIQGSINEYEGYVNRLSNKFTNVNDMLDYYRNSLGEDFKIDKPLYDLQEVVADIVEDVPEKFDAFEGVDKSITDMARKFQDAFLEMGIEEGIIKEASDYISYVFHMINPELKDNKIVEKLKKQGFDKPFNINSLDRKLKGSIEEINKTIKNEYGIDNWFETNIFKIFANRSLNHEKFMYKKHLTDMLDVSSIEFDVLNAKDLDHNSIEDLASKLGIEWENPVLKDGIGMEKRFINPKEKAKHYKETEIEQIDPITGKKTKKKVMKDYDPTKLQAEWKSYTGKKDDFIDMAVRNPSSVLDRGAIQALINETQLSEKEVERLLGMVDKKSLSIDEATELADLLKLSNHEYLPNSAKANVQYSPKEKDRMLLDQIRQKIYNIQKGNDPDYVMLKDDIIEEEKSFRKVKDSVLEKRSSEELMSENKAVQEQITTEMLQDLTMKGMSIEEALEQSGKGEFIVELKARLKEANQDFELLGYADNQFDLAKDTVEATTKEVLEHKITIANKNLYNQYNKMIDEVNGKKTNSILKVYDKFMNTFKSWALTSTGFHVNNIVGGTFNNFMQIGIDSLNPKTVLDVQSMLKELKKVNYEPSKISGTLYGKSKQDIAQAIIDNGLLSTFMSIENTNLEDFINTGAKSIVEKKSPLKKLMGAVNPLDTQNNALIKGSGAFGNWSEQSMKLQNFFAHIKNGEEIGISADLSKEAMFDYSDMTNFNEGIKKYLFPFITFVQKNGVFQAEQISKSPWKGKVVLKGMEQSNDQASEKEKFLTPDYLKEGIRIGENTRFNVELPTMSFIQSLNPVDMMNQLNPLLKAPFEYLTNKQMYSGNDISRMNDSVEKLKYSARTLLPMIKTHERLGALVVGDKEEKDKTPLEKLISGSETKSKSIDWLKGNKVKTFDTEKAESQRMYEYMELLKQMYLNNK